MSMMGQRSVTFSRRAGLAVALASIVLARPESSFAAVIQQRGMAGGGLVALQHGQAAHVSLIATQSTFPDERKVVAGSILWVEAGTGLSLASGDVTAYEELPGEEHGRRIWGTMNVEGKGTFPFVLDIVDAGPPGSGEDQIALTVGDDVSIPDAGTASDESGKSAATQSFHYQAAGFLVIGDVQDVDLDIPID
jgi:hypothetical protein